MTTTPWDASPWKSAWGATPVETLLLVAPDTFDSSESIPVGSVLWSDHGAMAHGAPACRYHKEFYPSLPSPTSGRVYADRCIPLRRPAGGLRDAEPGDLVVARFDAEPMLVGVVHDVLDNGVQVRPVTFTDSAVGRIADEPVTLLAPDAEDWRVALASPLASGTKAPEADDADRHRKDIRTISAALAAEAERRDWCSDYEDFLDALNQHLHIPLEHGDKQVTVRAGFYSDHTVTVEESGLSIDVSLRVYYTYSTQERARHARSVRGRVENDGEGWLIERREDWEFDRVECDDAEVTDVEELLEVVGDQPADLYDIEFTYSTE